MTQEEQIENPQPDKMPISDIYLNLSKIELFGLQENGTREWKMDKVCDSVSYQDVNYERELSEMHPYAALLRQDTLNLPIIAIHNDKKGPAIWIFSGMYGNEPSGTNMIAQNIEHIAKELSNIPTLILPLCNPHGYRLDQRFLNDAVESADGLSIDDASHFLIKERTDGAKIIEGYGPRSEIHAYETGELIRYLIYENSIRPPMMVIDLQETDSEKGYIEAYGIKKFENPGIHDITKAMMRSVGLMDYKANGDNQLIIKSISYPKNDNSIAEFVAAKRMIYGETLKGIAAGNVFKTKVPSKYVSLEKMMQAQKDALFAAIDMTRESMIKV